MLLVGDGEGAVILVVEDLFLAIEGQAILHVALHSVDGEGFAGLQQGFENSIERAGGVGLVDDLGDGFGAGQRANSEEGADAEQVEEQHDYGHESGDAEALDSEAGDDDENEHGGAEAGEAGGGDGSGRGQNSGI